MKCLAIPNVSFSNTNTVKVNLLSSGEVTTYMSLTSENAGKALMNSVKFISDARTGFRITFVVGRQLLNEHFSSLRKCNKYTYFTNNF